MIAGTRFFKTAGALGLLVALLAPACGASPENGESGGSLFTRACDSSDARGCAALGFLFEQGRGVRKDEARAAALFTKACSLTGEASWCAKAKGASKRP